MPALLQTEIDACLSPASGDLVSVEQALAIGLAEARPIAETELVDLSAAEGRILAQAVKADEPLPHDDAMSTPSGETWVKSATRPTSQVRISASDFGPPAGFNAPLTA